jgi:proteasome lid subunit RPN8/RPN11
MVKSFRERAVEDHPPSGLRINAVTYDAIIAHLHAWLPAEGCGLIATSFEPDGNAERVERFYPGSNVRRSSTSFEMDPKEVVTALKQIEANGWRLGAIVHAHPTPTATPSDTDLRQAFYPGALMAIVSFKDATPELRAWHVSTHEERAEVVGEAPVLIE